MNLILQPEVVEHTLASLSGSSLGEVISRVNAIPHSTIQSVQRSLRYNL